MTRTRTDSSTTQEQPPALRIPRAGGAGRGSNNIYPPVSLSFPGDDRQDEATRKRDRIAALLSDIERGQINV
jgi:hypothetical protein